CARHEGEPLYYFDYW
nr:immunoglobulin heavy chain junction region [Mus musculus]